MFGPELDFAFFAARLGWSKSDYEETTPVERQFIRKELEAVTVSDSDILASAVQLAVANALSKKRRGRKLWTKRRKKASPVISKREIGLIQKIHEENTPWTPWQGKGAAHG